MTPLLSELNVTGLSGLVQDVNVEINISHTWPVDLRVSLISPALTEIVLFSQEGNANPNFTGTVLDDEAASSITSCSSPCTGTWRPEVPLSTFDSESPNAVWKLKVEDLAEVDQGTLDSWSLTIVDGG